jgi:hypothetical protein
VEPPNSEKLLNALNVPRQFPVEGAIEPSHTNRIPEAFCKKKNTALNSPRKKITQINPNIKSGTTPFLDLTDTFDFSCLSPF